MKQKKGVEVDTTSLDKISTFYVNSNVDNTFSKLAKKQGMTKSALMRQLMIEYIKNKKSSD